MKHRKIIRLLVIPAALFITLLTVLVMCRRSAIDPLQIYIANISNLSESSC